MKFYGRLSKSGGPSNFFYYITLDADRFSGFEYSDKDEVCRYGKTICASGVEFVEISADCIPDKFRNYIQSNVWLLDINREIDNVIGYKI